VTIGPYYVGDNPATPITFDLYSEEDFSAYTSATVSIVNPLGATVATVGAVPVEEETITFAIPAGSLLTPGIYAFDVLLLGEGMVTLPSVAFVVQEANGWHSLESARREWRDAPEDDAQLFAILDAAREQCLEFAPETAGLVPLRFRQAQLLQARSLWQSGSVSQDGALGGGEMSVTVFPMDWTVKALLRPKRAVGAIF
jgi:hypothetical protein